MRQVEKYYNFYIPILNRAHSFQRINDVLTVKLRDEEVFEVGSEHLAVIFPRDLTIYDLKAKPMHSEAKWILTARVKEWGDEECV